MCFGSPISTAPTKVQRIDQSLLVQCLLWSSRTREKQK